jgi:hypothetical protein
MISNDTFKSRVKSGDLLLTRASNNWLSFLQSKFIKTPVSHVGLAYVNALTRKTYMFESGAPRGAQLRDLDEYMSEGADYVWWRQLDDTFRDKVVAGIEKYAKAPYSWSFLRQLPKEILGIEAPGQEGDKFNSFSCAELVARIYEEAGAIGHKRHWLPIDFLDDFPSLGNVHHVAY